MKEYISKSLGIITKETLDRITRSQLAALHNEVKPIDVAPIFEVKLRKDIVDRIKEFLFEEQPQKKFPADYRADRKRTSSFNYPPGPVQRKYWPNTKRAHLIKLLSRPQGATIEECQLAIGWKYYTCCQNIYLLHIYLGYGLREDSNGQIHLFDKNGK
jgi:hypothetical protein